MKNKIEEQIFKLDEEVNNIDKLSDMLFIYELAAEQNNGYINPKILQNAICGVRELASEYYSNLDEIRNIIFRELREEKDNGNIKE